MYLLLVPIIGLYAFAVGLITRSFRVGQYQRHTLTRDRPTEQLTTELIDWAFNASNQSGALLRYAEFWHDQSLSGPEAHSLIQPLLAKRVFEVPPSDAYPVVQLAIDAGKRALRIPPVWVSLSPKNYAIQLNRDSMPTPITKVKKVKKNNISVGPNSVLIGNVLAQGKGNQSAAAAQDVRVAITQDGASLDGMARLARALREDASRAQDAPLMSEELRGVAADIESDLAQASEGDEAAKASVGQRLMSSLQRALRFVGLFGAATEATKQVLDDLGITG